MLSEPLTKAVGKLIDMVDQIQNEFPRIYFATADEILDALREGLLQAIADENLKDIRSYADNLTFRVNGRLPPSSKRDFYSQELDYVRFRIADITSELEKKAST